MSHTVDEHVGTSPPVYTLIDEPFQVVVQPVGARYTQTTEFFSEHFSLYPTLRVLPRETRPLPTAAPITAATGGD